MQNEERQITFNDIPEVLSEILKKFDLLDQSMELIREEVRRTKRPSLSDHIPMDVKEACEFLKIKKSTMYTYIQNGEIPVNQKGKKLGCPVLCSNFRVKKKLVLLLTL